MGVYMEDSALQWLKKRIPDLKCREYVPGALASRVTLLTNWLWMDERFDTRLDGLLGAILMAWKNLGRLPVTLFVNRVTPQLEEMSEEWGIRLVVDRSVRGGGGNVKDLNRNAILHTADWFDTEYVLTFQDHAFPIRSGLEAFLDEWDYVAAPWLLDADDWITRVLLPRRGHVGNGAFSLRSRKLCEEVARSFKRGWHLLPHCYLFNDDYFIGKTLPSWDSRYRREVSIAPPEVAARFSLECNRILQDEYGRRPFGFHGPEAFSYLLEKGLVEP